FDRMADIPDGSIDLVMTSPPSGRAAAGSAERLAPLAAVERLHLLGDLGHAGGDLGSPLRPAGPCTPRLDVRLGDEDSPTLPHEGDVAELHRLHSRGVAASCPFAGFGQRYQRLTVDHLGDDEGAV